MDLSWGNLNWLDVVLVIVILWGGLRGFRRGFVHSFFGLLGLLIAFPVAGFLTPGIADFLQRQWQVTERLSSFLARHISLSPSLATVDLQSVSVTQLLELLKAQHLPGAYLEAVARVFSDLVSAATANGAQTVGDFVFFAMAAILLNTILFIVLFSLIQGIFNSFAAGSTRRAGLGFIGLFNRLIGFVFGLITATIGLMVFLGIVTPLTGLESFGAASTALEGSAISQFLLRVFYLVSPWIVQGGHVVAR